MTRDDRARQIVARLRTHYPGVTTALAHRNAYELLAATILSAQCTDARVNLVTPSLFAAYPTPADLARADRAELEAIVRSTGFYRNKAKSLIGMARGLVERHGGEVPRSMAAMVELPGVARKTANVVLGTAYGMNEGIAVDTHVARVARRLGLTREADPPKIERDLMAVVPRPEWTEFSHRMIWHGRKICAARAPRCAECPLGDLCPSRDLFLREAGRKAGTKRTGSSKSEPRAKR
jgi:endonuclease-3